MPTPEPVNFVRRASCPLAVLMAVALCVGSGCDSDLLAPSTVEVAGRVTLDGQALVEANILLVPLDATGGRNQYLPLSSGQTGSNGEYTLKTPDSRTGAARGLHLVLISKRKPVELPAEESARGGIGDPDNPLPSVAASGDLIQQLVTPWMSVEGQDRNEIVPAHYNRESVLTAIIEKRGNSNLDFELDSVDPWAKQNTVR